MFEAESARWLKVNIEGSKEKGTQMRENKNAGD